MLTVVPGDGSGHEGGKDRWRAVNAPHLVALVRNGATFVNGKLVVMISHSADDGGAVRLRPLP